MTTFTNDRYKDIVVSLAKWGSREAKSELVRMTGVRGHRDIFFLLSDVMEIDDYDLKNAIFWARQNDHISLADEMEEKLKRKY